MKKFFAFFATTAGIIILVLAVIAIILITYNWDAIKAWWNDDTDVTPPVTEVDPNQGQAPLESFPILDDIGRFTGGYYQTRRIITPGGSAEAPRVPCRKVTTVVNGVTYTGWVGDCDFPRT